jgi:Na+-transporting NADH:ubiquinone oxidoreductase subunit F
MREAFYVEEFDQLQAGTPNFTWLPGALPPAGRQLDGLHWLHPQRAFRELPQKPPGSRRLRVLHVLPPVMNAVVIKMLTDQGVERENILLDDFGG